MPAGKKIAIKGFCGFFRPNFYEFLMIEAYVILL